MSTVRRITQIPGRTAKRRTDRGRVAIAVSIGTLLSLVVPSAMSLATSKASHARVKYISGHINVAGYTIAAVGYNGKVSVSRSRTFRIPAPDTRITLQLITSRGRYAGPVVVGGSATRVITGIKAGTSVGTIDVVASRGYARLARKPARASLDTTRWAYAKNGVPIGNGRNLGLVVSKGTGGGTGPGQDQAHVGIPNEFDIAVPGTRTLKSLAPIRQAKVASIRPTSGSLASPTPGGPAPTSVSPWMSQMFLSMADTVNADVADVTQGQIDSTLQANLNLKLLQIPAGNRIELDCNGLSFCAPGGSGQAQLEGLPAGGGGVPSTVPFPGGSLDPATGFGEIVGPGVPTGLLGGNGGGSEFSLNPHATSAQIGSGDVITELINSGGTTTQLPTTIDFVFNTVPAIIGYSDSAGETGAISYPDTSGLGGPSDPLPVAAGPGGDVVMTFTVVRPQRAGVPGAGEAASVDIGHLGYELDYVPNSGPGGGSPQCPASTYSNLSPALALSSAGTGGFGPPPGMGWLVDSANDQPASPGNTLSFSVDLTQCLASKGTSSFPVGQVVNLDLSANSQSSSDHANQTFSVIRTH